MQKPTGWGPRDRSRRDVMKTVGILMACRPLGAVAAALSPGAPMSTPTMTGPLTGGAHGFPFGSPSAQEVERRGYVMEEFLLAGTARSYEAVSGTVAERDGRWRVQVASTKPYVTRLYVVRPADPRRFNGVVVVNWQNVTTGVDLGSPFGGPGAFGDEISRGYAWVGVTTQELAVTGVARDRGFPGLPARTVGLREWDPQRYGTLQHPGDAFSYDIFSQAGRLVKAGPSASGVDPLGGLRPRMVLATGGSQSATRLTSYINAAHSGERVYDGFLLYAHWGFHQPLVEQDHLAMFVPAAAGGYAGSCRIRDDGGVPVLVQSSECEHPTSVAARQPDSPTYRHWEIAGASHVPFQPPPPGAPAAASSAAQGPMPNAINWTYLLDSALRSLVRWVDRKQPPASQPRIRDGARCHQPRPVRERARRHPRARTRGAGGQLPRSQRRRADDTARRPLHLHRHGNDHAAGG